MGLLTMLLVGGVVVIVVWFVVLFAFGLITRPGKGKGWGQ